MFSKNAIKETYDDRKLKNKPINLYRRHQGKVHWKFAALFLMLVKQKGALINPKQTKQILEMLPFECKWFIVTPFQV